MMITIGISNWTGYLFTRSLYERAIRGKQMPVIKDQVPPVCRNILAENVMCKNLVTLNNVSNLKDIAKALSTKHHAFPVLNSKGNFVGLIPRNFLLILVSQRHFYGSNVDSSFANDNPEYGGSSKQMENVMLSKSPTNTNRSS